MPTELRSTMPTEVFREWKAIGSSVAELHLFWSFYKGFCGNEQNVALMMEILPVPFTIIRRALLLSITMEVGKLMDQDQKPIRNKTLVNLSLKRLVNLVKPHCPDILNAKLAIMLDELRAVCE